MDRLPKSALKKIAKIKQQDLVPISEAAEILGVSIDTIRRWDKAGRLSAHRPNGKDRFFSIQELEKIKFEKPLSISEASSKLGISPTTLRRIEKKGLITPKRNDQGERIYDHGALENFLNSEYFLRQKEVVEKVVAPLKEFGGEVEKRLESVVDDLSIGRTGSKTEVLEVIEQQNHELIQSLITTRKIAFFSGSFIVVTLMVLVSTLTALFLIFPEDTGSFFGFRKSLSFMTAPGDGGQVPENVLGVSVATEPTGGLAADLLEPVGKISLSLVKQINRDAYTRAVGPEADEEEKINQIVQIDNSNQYVVINPLKFSSRMLRISDNGLIESLNANFVQSRQPGTGAGDLLFFGEGNKVENLIIGNTNLENGSVSGGRGGVIADGSITTADLAEGLITGVNIEDGSITTEKLADNAVTAAKLADDIDLGYLLGDDSIISEMIKAGEVKNSDLADGSIDSNKLIDGTILAKDLASALTFAEERFLDLGAVTHSTAVLQGLRLPNVTSATPVNPESGEGFLAYDTSGDQVIFYNGTTWGAVGSGDIQGVTAGTGLSGGGNTGTVTLSIDNTVATLTGTQTLTNKSISGAANTFSNIPNSALTNSSVTVTAGNGLNNGGSVALGGSTSLAVRATGSGTSVNSSSNSGLEVSADGVALLRGCQDGELLKWDAAFDIWTCSVDSGGGGGGGSVIVQESDVNISTTASVIDFLGTDFTLTQSPAGEANVTIDYTNSKITRNDQAESISGGWTFSNLTVADNEITFSGGSKTFDLTGAATRTLTILNSTASQVADLELSDGALITAGAIRLTNAGILQNITGLTVSSGTVSLPSGQIDNTELANSTIGVIGNSGSASISLGNSLTLSGAGIASVSVSGSTATITATEADTLAAVTARGATTAIEMTLTRTGTGLTIKPGSAPAASTKLLDLQQTGVGTTVFSVDYEGDIIANSLDLATALADSEVADNITVSSGGSVDSAALTGTIDTARIANLTTADFASAAISQWTNDSGYLSTVDISANTNLSASNGIVLTGDALTLDQSFAPVWTGLHTFTRANAQILMRPSSAPAADTKLLDIQTTGTTTSVFSVDAEGDVIANSLDLSTALADSEVADAITISASGSVAAAAITGSITDSQVSDTLTASIFAGSGSTTNAVDLATAEVAGTLADGNVANDLTISSSGSVDWTALVNYPTACSAGQAVTAVGDTLTCSTVVTSESDGVVGNEVTNVTNSTLTRSGAGTGGDPYTLGLNLGNANTWSLLQTYSAGVSVTQSGNTSNDYALYLKRNTDSSPLGYLIRARNAAEDTNLFAVDVTGTVTSGIWNGTALTDAYVSDTLTSSNLVAGGSVVSNAEVDDDLTISAAGSVAAAAITGSISDSQVSNTLTSSIFIGSGSTTDAVDLGTAEVSGNLTGSNIDESTLSGLSTSNFASAAISQWSNDSGYLSTVDISSNTNLTASNGVTLTGDALSLDVTYAPTWTGLHSFTRANTQLLLKPGSAPSANTKIIDSQATGGGTTTFSVDYEGDVIANSLDLTTALADSEVADSISISAAGSVAAAAITGTITDAQVSDTLTSSDLVAGGSVVSNAEVDDDLTISFSGTVAWTALSSYPSACSAGQAVTAVGDTLTCSTFVTSEGDGVVGNEVTNVTNSTLTRSGAGTSGDPYTLSLNLNNANTWTALQTFSNGGSFTQPANTADDYGIYIKRNTDTSPLGYLIRARNAAEDTNLFAVNAAGVLVAGSTGTGFTVDFTNSTLTGNVTGTNIDESSLSGLTTANFASANISQWSNNSGYITAASTDTLTNKTIAAGSNTISGLTNSNLSGTAGITNANLANSSVTVTAGDGLTDGGAVALGSSISLNIGAGSGITVGVNDVAVNLTTSGTTGASSSNSGLEVGSSGLSLIKGCSDNEILKWSDAGGWACSTDASGGSVTVRESDGSPSVASISTLEFGPAATSTDEFIVSDEGSSTSRIRAGNKIVQTDATQTLTNKTVSGASNTLTNIGNASLVNSSVTVTAGAGLSGGGAVSLGASTSVAIDFTSANTWSGLQTYTGGISSTQLGNTSSAYALYLKRNTDTLPEGYLIRAQNAAADTNLFAVDITGAVTTGIWNGTALTDAYVSDTLTSSNLVAGGSVVSNAEVDDDLTISASGSVAAAAITGSISDSQVSDTLTASIFAGSGSTTNAVDLGTAEVAGTLADGNVSDAITIDSSGNVAWTSLNSYPSACGAGTAITALGDIPTCTSFVTAEADTLAAVTGRGNTTSTGISLTENGNTASSYALYIKRNTDSSPDGYLIQAQNAAADTNLFVVNVSGTVTTGSWNGTAITDTYINDAITVSDSGSVAAAAITGTVTDAQVSNTLTSSIFAGSGSSTDAVDLGTAEVAGTLADGNVADNLTISSSGTVDWAALSNYPAACDPGEAITAVGDTLTCDTFSASESGDAVIGNEVTNATNATLTRSGAGTGGDPYTLGLNLGNANTWSVLQTFSSGVSVASGQSYTGAGAVTLSSGGAAGLTVDSASGVVSVATGDYLALSKNGTAGAAAGYIWYDSSDNKFKVNENGSTKILCNSTDQSCGSGSGSSWSGLSNPTTGLSLSHGEYTTNFNWDTAATAAGFNAVTFGITNDAGTDSNTQQLLVLQNNDDGGATGTTETGLLVHNADTNESLTDGLKVTSLAGGITTGLNLNDTDIVTAIVLQQGESINNSTDNQINMNIGSSGTLLLTSGTQATIANSAGSLILDSAGGTVSVAAGDTLGNGTWSIDSTGAGTSLTATDLSCTNCIGATEISDLALGTDTSGDYVASFTAGNGLTGDASGEGSTPTLAVGAGTGITVNANDVAINTDAALTWTNATGYSLSEAEDLQIDWSVSGTQAGQAQVVTVTNSAASGNQYGLYLDNTASSGSTESLLVLDNSDADTAVGAAIQIVDAGGTFTTIIDNNGTLISGTELNRLDGKDAALLDVNDSVATAITGTGTLTSGASGAGFTINFGTSTLSGDVTGANISGVDISDDTNLSASDGLSLTGDALTNTDKGTSQNIFKTIVVAGQSDVITDTNSDSLTLVAGLNVSITTNAGTDTITINATDNDTTYTAGNDLDLTGTTFSLETTLDFVDTINLAGTGTLNGLDVIDGTTETTLEGALDIGGEVTGTGLGSVTINSNVIDDAELVDALTYTGALTLTPASTNGLDVNLDPDSLITIDQAFSGTTTANSITQTITNTSSSGTQNGLYIDNAASSGTTESLLVLDNSDADTAVTNAIEFIDAGGTFTNLFNVNGTLITATEFTRLDGKDAALVDVNDAVGTAITGTGTLTSGATGAGFTINFGASTLSGDISGSNIDESTLGGLTTSNFSSDAISQWDNDANYITASSSDTLTNKTFDANGTGNSISNIDNADLTNDTINFDKINSSLVLDEATTVTAGGALNLNIGNNVTLTTTGTGSIVASDVSCTGCVGTTDVAGLDISDDTNLTASNGVTLTGDALSLDVAYAPTWTGLHTFTKADTQLLLKPGSAPSANTKIIDSQATGGGTTTFSVDYEGDVVANSLDLSVALPDSEVADTLTIGSSSTVDWSALNNYPSACGAGTAITALGDTPTCSAFLTAESGDSVIGNEVTNVTNATLTRAGAGTGGDPYTLSLNLGNANTWTALQTFSNGGSFTQPANTANDYGIYIKRNTDSTPLGYLIRARNAAEDTNLFAVDVTGTVTAGIWNGTALTDTYVSDTLTIGAAGSVDAAALTGTIDVARIANLTTGDFTSAAVSQWTNDANYITASSSDTLTNKTFDANGTGNSISNIDNADLTNDTINFDKINSSLVLDEATTVTAGGALNLNIGNNVTLTTTGTGAIVASDVVCTGCVGTTDVTGLDISDDTNLTASNGVALTGDALSLDVAYAPTWTGLHTFTKNDTEILLKPGSAPAANTKLFDVQQTGAGTTVFSVDYEGDVIANSLDLTTALADSEVADTLTIGASSTVDWSALSSYPSACGAGTAVTALGDTPTCTAFLTAESGDSVIGNEVTNVTNATLTRSGAGTGGDPYTLALNLGNANIWTATQTYTQTIAATGSAGDVNLTLGDDGDADTVSALTLDVTSAATGDADTLYALNIGNTTNEVNVLEYAIRIGSGWQEVLDLNGTLLSATELGRLDGKDAALVDADDAVGTAITGTGTLTSGATGTGFTLNFTDSTLSGNVTGANISGVDVSDDTNLSASDGITLTGDALTMSSSAGGDGLTYTTGVLAVGAGTGISVDANSVSATLGVSIANSELDNDTIDLDKVSASLTLDEATTVTAAGALNLNIGNNVTLTTSGTGVITATNLVAGSSVVSNGEVDDDLTISSSGTVDWSALSSYPSACGAGTAITALGDTPTCSAFLTAESGDSVIGNEVTNVTNSTLTRSGAGTGGDPYTLGLNLDNANTWTASQTLSLAEAETLTLSWSVSGTQAGQAQIVTVTNSSSGGVQNGLYLDNAANTGTTESLLVLDNSDNNTAVTNAIEFVDAGGTFTNLFNVAGTTITSTEFTRLDGKDAALVDVNDAVTTAITGTGTLASGATGTGFTLNFTDSTLSGNVTGTNIDESSLSGIGNSSLTNDTIDFDKINSSLTLDEQTDITAGSALSLRIGNNVTLTTTGTGVITATNLVSGSSVVSNSEVDDDLTISSSGTVDWSALSNYPSACGAGTAITALGDTPTCSAFLTAESGDSVIGNEVTNATNATLSRSGAGTGGDPYTLGLNLDNANTWTASQTLSLAEAETLTVNWSVSGTQAGQASIVTVTNSSSGGVQNGLYIDNAANSGTTESLLVLDNSDNNTAVTNAIEFVDAGGTFTNLFNVSGTTITSTEFTRLDGKDAALVDVNDAVTTAITGTGTMTSGATGAGFTLNFGASTLSGDVGGSNIDESSLAGLTTSNFTSAAVSQWTNDANYITAASSDILTNKTFDANGTGNSISNIDNGDLTNDTLDFDKINSSLTLDEATTVSAGSALNLNIGNNVTLTTTGTGAIVATDLVCTGCVGTTDVTGLDISDDTNLTASNGVALSGDALSLDVTYAPTWTGLHTFTRNNTAILIKPASAPAGNTLLVDIQQTGAGTTVFSVDYEGDLVANSLNLATELPDSEVSDTLTASNLVAASSVVADAEVDDDLTIGASGAVTWSALASYPSGCGAGEAVSTIGDSLTCTAFNTDTAISLDDAYNNGQTITVDAADILFDLNDATNDYKFVIDNNTNGTIASAFQITTAGGVSSVFTTAVDVSDPDIVNALNLGSNNVLGDGSVSFDLANTTDNVLTLTNSTGSTANDNTAQLMIDVNTDASDKNLFVIESEVGGANNTKFRVDSDGDLFLDGTVSVGATTTVSDGSVSSSAGLTINSTSADLVLQTTTGGNLVINSAGNVLDINDPTIDVSTQATDVEIADASGTALTFSQSTFNYLTVDTTDNAEQVTVGNSSNNTGITLDIGGTGTLVLSDFTNGGVGCTALETNATGVLVCGADDTGGALSWNSLQVPTGNLTLAMDADTTAFNWNTMTTQNAFTFASTSVTHSSGDIVSINQTASMDDTSTVTGNLLDISRALDINAGGTRSITVSSPVVSISDTCTEGASDTCNNSGNVLQLTQSFGTSTGDALAVSNAGTGAGASITLANAAGTRTDGFLINQSAAGTTTNGLHITESAGAVTNGINIGSGIGTAIVLQNGETIDNGAVDGTMALAANSGALTLSLGGAAVVSNTSGDLTIDANSGLVLADTSIQLSGGTTTLDVNANASTTLQIVNNNGANVANLSVENDLTVTGGTVTGNNSEAIEIGSADNVISMTIGAAEEYTFNATTLDMQSNTLTDVGTNITATGALTVTSTGANALTLDSGSGTVTIAAGDTLGNGTWSINSSGVGTSLTSTDLSCTDCIGATEISDVYLLNDGDTATGSYTFTLTGTQGLAINSGTSADTAVTASAITIEGEDTIGADEAQIGLSLVQSDNGADVTEAADTLLAFTNNDANDPVNAGIRFDAGAAGVDFTTGIDFDAADFTTEIRLESAETISNQSDGVIALGTDSGAVTLSLAGAATVSNTSGVLILDGNTGLTLADSAINLTGGTSITMDASNASNVTLALTNSDAGTISLRIDSLTNGGAGCDTIDTDTNGTLICGTDAGAAASPFGSAGGVITKSTGTDQLRLTMAQAGDYGLLIDASTAPTVDLVQITNTGQASATSGVDGLQITFDSANASGDGIDIVLDSITGNGSDTTNAIDINNFSYTSSAGTDVVRGLNVGNLTESGTITSSALNIGTGWDSILDSSTLDITGAGAITGASGVSSSGTITFSGLTSCGALSTDSSGNLVCGTAVGDTATFTDANPAAMADNDTTELFNDATVPNIVTNFSSSTVLVSVVITDAAAAAADDEFDAVSIARTTNGVDPVCGTDPSVGIILQGGFVTANTQPWGLSGTFLDSPGVAGTIKYQVCTSTQSVGTVNNAPDSIQVTLVELGADLAENYYTKDDSIQPGDVVSIDRSLPAGAKKSSKAYDGQVLGIVSTAPKMVLDDWVGRDQGRPVPVALSGRVPVKVTTENGAIKEGDLLTTSSTPGVAMKATKAGQIIGQAMTPFDGEGVGQVFAFIKTDYWAGSKVADLMPGLTLGTVSNDPTMGKQVLAQFMEQKDQLGEEVDLSEVVTDRVAAGLEIITPTIYADKIFAGSIEVDSIKANQIEGLELLISSISYKDASVSGQVAGIATSSASPINFGADGLATVSGLLSADSLSVQNESIFAGFAQFLESVTARNLIVTEWARFMSDVFFKGDVEFEGRPTFNNDTAGVAIVKKDAQEVEVRFENEYKSLPQVTVSINLDDAITDEERALLQPSELEDKINTQKALEDAVLNGDIRHIVTRKTNKSFVIKLNNPASTDIQFSWTAIGVTDARTVVGDKAVQTAQPSSGPAVESPTPSPSITPTPSPTPEPELKQTVIIKNNDLGYLRVREEPTTSGTEIGQVDPGQQFEVLEEKNGWYRIGFEEGKSGWVKGTYVSLH